MTSGGHIALVALFRVSVGDCFAQFDPEPSVPEPGYEDAVAPVLEGDLHDPVDCEVDGVVHGRPFVHR